MPLDLSSLEKSVAALRAVISRAEDASLMSRLDETTRQAIRSGVIQHFEFTFELCCARFRDRRRRVLPSTGRAQ